MNNLINTETDLIKKGYSEEAIKEITRWGLLNTEKIDVHIPDLKAKKRIGVVKKLSVGTLRKGYCDDLVIILKPFSSYRKKINPSNLNDISSLLQIEHSLGTSDETKKSDSDLIKSCINLDVSSTKCEWKWDVLVLTNANSTIGHLSGTSAGSAICLALFSAKSEIPIPNNVAITGVLEEKTWQVKAIGGLKEKVISAVEKGANIIIIPEENRREYNEEVPDYVKDKIEKIIFTETASDLHQFLADNYPYCYSCGNKAEKLFFMKSERDKQFCSDYCRSKYYTFNCSNCQKLTHNNLYQGKTEEEKFCSSECLNKSQNVDKIPEIPETPLNNPSLGGKITIDYGNSLKPEFDYYELFISLLLIIVGLVVLLFVSIYENKKKKEEENKPKNEKGLGEKNS